ncbi:hypothetical protein [Rhodoplanes sp. SY1]|uniref:hypothetical protein n=1 Tax=Rhodoplanes sp. SY1 TaxID=3166646 RepID=UPI0038B517F0
MTSVELSAERPTETPALRRRPRARGSAARLAALLAGLASVAVAMPAEAGHRRDRTFVGSFVVVRTWTPPTWSVPQAGWVYGVPAIYGRAVRTKVYPYGPRGDAKTAYWYPHLVYGRCGCAVDGLCC